MSHKPSPTTANVFLSHVILSSTERVVSVTEMWCGCEDITTNAVFMTYA